MANGRTYTVIFSAVSVSAAQDLFEISPADDRPIELVGLSLGQTSDVADAAEEILQISVIRGHTTSGSGGTAPTPAALNPLDAAAGFTAEVNNTTVASAGTTQTLHTDVWNVRAGYLIWWPPEARPVATQGNTTIVIRQTAPADALTMSGTLYVREL